MRCDAHGGLCAFQFPECRPTDPPDAMAAAQAARDAAVDALNSLTALAQAAERERIAALADAAGAEYLTGVRGQMACEAACKHGGPGNQPVGGVHRHPFSDLIRESS